jgi:hypothetical protein
VWWEPFNIEISKQLDVTRNNDDFSPSETRISSMVSHDMRIYETKSHIHLHDGMVLMA